MAKKNPLEDLVGNVYTNLVTGNKWKIIKVKNNIITLQNKSKTATFNTTLNLMVNYTYIGKRFSKKLKKLA